MSWLCTGAVRDTRHLSTVLVSGRHTVGLCPPVFLRLIYTLISPGIDRVVASTAESGLVMLQVNPVMPTIAAVSGDVTDSSYASGSLISEWMQSYIVVIIIAVILIR